MLLEINQISRDWTILHEGRRFYVNFTESDGQTLALCNRGHWEVWEETDEGTEELQVHAFQSDTPEEGEKVRENVALMEKLIQFCIENWDGQFMQETKATLQEQKELIRGISDD